MSKTHEYSARSVDEAIQKGLEDLQIEADEAVIEVIDEGDSGGLFGFGRKDAVVQIALLNDEEETEQSELLEDATEVDNSEEDIVSDVNQSKLGKRLPSLELTSEDREEIEADAVKFVASVLQSLDIHGKISSYFDEENILHLNVIGDNLGAAIGRRGETLDSLEYLTILAVNKNRDDYARISLDIGGYRERRIKSVTQQAIRSADRVLQSGRKYTLKAMNSAERRQVHIALQDYSGVRTSSEGREPDRSVVIYPANE